MAGAGARCSRNADPLRVRASLIVLTLFLACGVVLGTTRAAAQGPAPVLLLQARGVVDPIMAQYLTRGIAVAEARQARLVVIQLDTPGGLDTSMRAIVQSILSSRVPVAVYVEPPGARAASAGLFLAMAGHVAAMAPGTNSGAAHPVGGHGEELGKTIAEKAANDAAALARSLASQRGRGVEWAEKAVRESASYTDREALEHKLIDLVVNDRDELLKALNGRVIKRFDGREEKLVLDAPEVVEVGPSQADKLLSAIAHPNIAYLLLLAGIVGIYFELSHPGAIFPGVLGGISILLALFALSVLPVNYVGIMLIVLAIGFFIAEVKVTSYGLLTVAGLISFVIGSLMLIDSEIPALRVGLEVVLPAALMVAVIVIFLLTRVLRVHREVPLTGAEGIAGEVADVVVALTPHGKVFVHGEYWDAVGTAELPAGSHARVVRIEGKILVVEPLEDAAAPSR